MGEQETIISIHPQDTFSLRINSCGTQRKLLQLQAGTWVEAPGNLHWCSFSLTYFCFCWNTYIWTKRIPTTTFNLTKFKPLPAARHPSEQSDLEQDTGFPGPGNTALCSVMQPYLRMKREVKTDSTKHRCCVLLGLKGRLFDYLFILSRFCYQLGFYFSEWEPIPIVFTVRHCYKNRTAELDKRISMKLSDQNSWRWHVGKTK